MSAWPKGSPNVKLTWQYCSWPPDASTSGICLTEGQPDPKAHQMSSRLDIVLLLATRCLYLGDMSDWRSAWPKGSPNIKLAWCSTALGHQMPLPRGTSDECKKDIWKFEHTLHFMLCFTEVFSMKDQQDTLLVTCLTEDAYLSFATVASLLYAQYQAYFV